MHVINARSISTTHIQNKNWNEEIKVAKLYKSRWNTKALKLQPVEGPTGVWSIYLVEGSWKANTHMPLT